MIFFNSLIYMPYDFTAVKKSHTSMNWPNFWSSLIASALMMELVLKMVLRMVKPWLSLTFVLQPFFSRSSMQFRLLSNTAIKRIVLPLAPDASTSAPDKIYRNRTIHVFLTCQYVKCEANSAWYLLYEPLWTTNSRTELKLKDLRIKAKMNVHINFPCPKYINFQFAQYLTKKMHFKIS